MKEYTVDPKTFWTATYRSNENREIITGVLLCDLKSDPGNWLDLILKPDSVIKIILDSSTVKFSDYKDNEYDVMVERLITSCSEEDGTSSIMEYKGTLNATLNKGAKFKIQVKEEDIIGSL